MGHDYSMLAFGDSAAFSKACKEGKADLRDQFVPNASGPLSDSCIRPELHNGGDDSSPSMQIHQDHVYCLGCNSYWWPDQFLDELFATKVKIDPQQRTYSGPAGAAQRVIYIPNSQVETYHANLFTYYPDRVEWLLARGLRMDTIKANLIGHTGEAFCIPVKDSTGLYSSLRFRRDDAMSIRNEDGSHSRPKYWGLAGSNAAVLYRPVGTAPEGTGIEFLCEGELDALRLCQEGLPAVSFTNGANVFQPAYIAYFDSDEKLYLPYDQDSPGRRAAQRIARLMPKAIPVLWPAALGKDITELLTNWPLRVFVKHVNESERMHIGS